MNSSPTSTVDVLEHRPCPVCGRTAGEPVFRAPVKRYSHERFETASWDGRCAIELRLIRCVCGLVRTDPAFRVDCLDRVYPEDLVPMERLLARVDSIFDIDSPKFNHMARHVLSFVPSGATLVDVGTRYGVFPWIAEQRYSLRALGIELNAAAVQVGRQRFAGIEHSAIAGLPQVLAKHSWSAVDAFVLDDVLEHLTHPGPDLDTLAQLQPAGGYLFLRQMDCAGLGARLFGDNWYYYQPAAHTFYFDEASLSALLDVHGYDLVDVRRSPRLTNALRTAWNLPIALWRRYAAQRSTARPSYLTQRLRAADDMMLATARKRG